AARSLTDWPGFMNSALPSMVQPVSSDARLSLIRGVSPIALAIPSRICMILSIWAFNWAVFKGSEANLSGKLRHHKFTKKRRRDPVGSLARNGTGAFDNGLCGLHPRILLFLTILAITEMLGLLRCQSFGFR